MDLADTLSPPAWVDSGAETTPGLDLLGLRLPVQVIGDSLLTGVTTVTPTVRYLSIHAWLVHSYAQARRPDRWSDFKAFAAIAESAVVLGNLTIDAGTVGLIGSDKGREILESGTSSLPLEQLVKQLAINTYANPSSQLGLTFPRDSGIPGLTEERGLPLAQSVANVVSDSELGAAISHGEAPPKVPREHLEELGQRLAMREVSGDERRLLLEGILPKNPLPRDRPRLETYATLLFLAQELGRLPEESDLFEAAREPQRSFPVQLHGTLDGWLRYSVRDLISTVGESVFKAIISTLKRLAEGSEVVPVNRVLGALLDLEAEHGEALQALGLARSQKPIWSTSFADLHDRVGEQLEAPRASSGGLERWAGTLHEWSIMDEALNLGPGSLSLLPVAWSLATWRTVAWDSAEYGPFEDRSDLGWARLGLDEVIRPTIARFQNERFNLREATEELALRMIDQHLRVAWSRMARDMRRDIAALTTDGTEWHSRGKEVVANRTGSRLPQAIGWLQQLGLIEEDGLTEEGRRALDRALRTLAEVPV